MDRSFFDSAYFTSQSKERKVRVEREELGRRGGEGRVGKVHFMSRLGGCRAAPRRVKDFCFVLSRVDWTGRRLIL